MKLSHRFRLSFADAPGQADASRGVAGWLGVVAALVFAMIVVGGATRLTDSGLSITEWRPVTGAVPPLTDAGWAAEFEKYRRIPEYRYVNAGMSLAEFKTIFWWEWGHRFLGRIIGLAFAAPFLFFLVTRRIPKTLVGRCWLLLALGGLQGAVGWWMVSSGLSERVDVAPERLTVHLGLALVLFGTLVWTALDAWGGKAGAGRRGVPIGAYALFGLVFVQCLLGGLVAGNDAGRVYTDWPLMAGRLFPAEYGEAGGFWRTLTHDLAAVQLHHRVSGYLLFGAAWGYLALSVRRGRSGAATRWAAVLAAVVTGQMLLGIVTLVMAAPVGLGILHQAGAVITFGAAAALAWTAGRSFTGDEVPATGWTGASASAKGRADTVLGAAT